MPYIITYEILRGHTGAAQKESARGALQMVGDIKTSGMKVLSIAHASGQVLQVGELEQIARNVEANRLEACE